MGVLHVVVGGTVDPEAHLALATKSVRRRETRKDQATESQFVCSDSSVEDVIGLTAATDENH